MEMSVKDKILEILRANGEGMSFCALHAKFLNIPAYQRRTGREFKDELETRLQELKRTGRVGVGYGSSGGPDTWHIWLKDPSAPGWS